MLVDAVETRLKELLYEKAAPLNLEMEGLQVRPDHVHLVVAVAPMDAPQHDANQFKGYTSRLLRHEFPHLKSTPPCLWSRSYYVVSARHVSADGITKDIEEQKTRE